MKPEYKEQQQAIIHALQVAARFDVEAEVERRTAFLCDYLVSTQRRSYVLGISGGVDSLAAALLAQSAVRRARERKHEARASGAKGIDGAATAADDAFTKRLFNPFPGQCREDACGSQQQDALPDGERHGGPVFGENQQGPVPQVQRERDQANAHQPWQCQQAAGHGSRATGDDQRTTKARD